MRVLLFTILILTIFSGCSFEDTSESSSEDIIYAITIANYAKENITLAIKDDENILLEKVVEAADLQATGHPTGNRSNITLSREDVQLQITAGGHTKAFHFSPDKGIYIDISYGTPGLISQNGEYISAYQSKEQVKYD